MNVTANKIATDRTKQGQPALWEFGGGMANTGQAQIIAGPLGESLTPVYVKRSGSLACGDHAMFAVNVGDIVVRAYHHRADFAISIARITALDSDAFLEPLHTYDQGQWNKQPDVCEYRDALTAAIDKARCYHCREPHHIVKEWPGKDPGTSLNLVMPMQSGDKPVYQ
jgi:hypothetical protein